MTQRERQILRWIEEDPMISQEQLAQKAGITRSSVAVHISNLTRKGYIAGKGYVVRSGSYAVVVGGVNMDIGGRSKNSLIAKDSNPGNVTMSLGGVGRNIAHNMSLLGVDVRFLTAMGDDLYGQRIASSCAELGIDIGHALRIEGGATPTYLFINDADGDMALAISDMDICEKISPAYLASKLSLLNNAQLVVVDTNIPVESLEYLANHCTVPIFADPVSTTKAQKLRGILGKLHTLKPNLIEAELLTGVKVTDEASLRLAAKTLLNTGLRRVFISMGSNGVFAADHNEMKIIPCFKAVMRNATGAGDSFMAALAWAYLQGTDLENSAKAAAATAAMAIEAETTINSEITADAVRARMNQ
ncbi:MAG: winged helix-turn-helix transcriptional regulator [Ruminococcaceae bacterium]|nr:winged helix-turn-helix transcriptional regulator [Oscillospiraceae bacterium]